MADDKTFSMGIHYLLGDYIAKRFKKREVVLDCCCGAGFMAIALAKNTDKIIAVDNDSEHLKQAKRNIKLAGFEHKIKFIFVNILDESILNKLPKIEAAFLDPDWSAKGKDKHSHCSKFSNMQPPVDKLFEKINKKTQNIVLRLPREVELKELSALPVHELEKVYLDDDFKFYCAYFGNLAKQIGKTEAKIYSHFKKSA